MVRPATTEKKKRAFRRGRISEYWAALYLLGKGYRIIAVRHKTKMGEIDLIVCKRDLVVFVEVKARRTVDDAVFAVSNASQKRIRNASDLWMMKQAGASTLSQRYDIIAIRPWSWPVHIVDAF